MIFHIRSVILGALLTTICLGRILSYKPLQKQPSDLRHVLKTILEEEAALKSSNNQVPSFAAPGVEHMRSRRRSSIEHEVRKEAHNKRKQGENQEIDLTKRLEISFPHPSPVIGFHGQGQQQQNHHEEQQRQQQMKHNVDTSIVSTQEINPTNRLSNNDIRDVTKNSDLSQILKWLEAISHGKEHDVTAALLVAKKKRRKHHKKNTKNERIKIKDQVEMQRNLLANKDSLLMDQKQQNRLLTLEHGQATTSTRKSTTRNSILGFQARNVTNIIENDLVKQTSKKEHINDNNRSGIDHKEADDSKENSSFETTMEKSEKKIKKSKRGGKSKNHHHQVEDHAVRAK